MYYYQKDRTIDTNMNGVHDADTHDCEDIQKRIDYPLAIGELPILAHPRASRVGKVTATCGHGAHSHYILDELLECRRYTGITAFDGGCDSTSWWDYVLNLGYDRKAWGLASDDCEDLEDKGVFNKGWIVVNSNVGPGRDYIDTSQEAKLRESIIENIRVGNFYAVARLPAESNAITTYGEPGLGPRLVLIVVDGKLKVSTDLKCTSIRFIGGPDKILLEVENTQAAAYAFTGSETYVRVEIDQIRGYEKYRAYSQPVYLR